MSRRNYRLNHNRRLEPHSDYWRSRNWAEHRRPQPNVVPFPEQPDDITAWHIRNLLVGNPHWDTHRPTAALSMHRRGPSRVDRA